MKTYFSKIIPRLQKYSEELDNKALLFNEHWVIFDKESNHRLVYIFRENNELLISKDGKVNRGNWEYLGNNSLLIEQGENSFLFNHGFLNERVMALKVDGKNEYAILLNEKKIQKKISSLKDIYELLENDFNESFLNPKRLEEFYPKTIKCPKCNNELDVSKKEFEIGESYCLNCHEGFQIKELEENNNQEENSLRKISSKDKIDNNFHETFTLSIKSDQEFLLPKKLFCPICRVIIELNKKERLEGSFKCPSCHNTINEERLNNFKNKESWYSIEGRIGRLEYFKRVILVAIPATIFESVGNKSGDSGLLALSVILLFLGSIYITIQAIKRLHDINYSGWHVLWSAVPIANLILLCILLFKSGEVGANRFGAEPK